MAKKQSAIEARGEAAGIPVYCAFDEIVDISTLVGNPRNPNRHDDEQIRLLAKIIRHQGWRAPITVSNRSGFIVRGHGRLMAAKVLKVSEVPVDRQDYNTEAEEWADLIADNRLAELATPDMPDLKDLLQELDTGALDMELTGYTEQAMADLMSQFHVEPNEMADTMGGLPDGEKPEFQQMTFTLHDSQAEEVQEALALAKKQGDFIGSPNENSNGNALARICAAYIEQVQYGAG